MIIYHEKWDMQIMVNTNEPTVLVFHELLELYNFQKNFLEQIDTGEGYISIFDEDKPLKIDKQVDYIPNLLTLSLNTRKTINYLHKKIINETAKSDQVMKFEELKNDLINWLKDVRKETFIDFTYDEELDIKNILKVFKVEFKERDDTPAELLCRYVDLLIHMTNIKVIIISFAAYLLSEEDLEYFINHCTTNDIVLILIEKEKPKNKALKRFFSIIDNSVLK